LANKTHLVAFFLQYMLIGMQLAYIAKLQNEMLHL